MTYFNWWEGDNIEPQYCPIVEEYCNYGGDYCDMCAETKTYNDFISKKGDVS